MLTFTSRNAEDIGGTKRIPQLALAVILCVVGPLAAESFDSKGVTIHYRELGDAKNADGTPRPIVLLIHGYMATGRVNWDAPGVTKQLAEKNRVIVLDNRGHGQSDKPQSIDEYGENMAEDAIRLLDHLKIAKAHVVGYSMGAMITMYLLVHHPDRIESAVIAGMGWLERPLQPPRSSEKLRPLEACRKSFPRMGITREQLQAIRVPMKVLIGSDDDLKRRVDRLQTVRPDVPVQVIPGANHLNTMFHKEFRDAVSQWIEDNAKSTTGKGP